MDTLIAKYIQATNIACRTHISNIEKDSKLSDFNINGLVLSLPAETFYKQGPVSLQEVEDSVVRRQVKCSWMHIF